MGFKYAAFGILGIVFRGLAKLHRNIVSSVSDVFIVHIFIYYVFNLLTFKEYFNPVSNYRSANFIDLYLHLFLTENILNNFITK